MEWETSKKRLRTAGASLSAACFCALLHASDTLPQASTSPLHETASSWPLVAMAAVGTLLVVIALAARRHLPFGRKG
jgi:hypothetical protein